MIHLIIGSMKSSKSTTLLNLAKVLSQSQKVALIAPSASTRDFFARNKVLDFKIYDESFDYGDCESVLIDEIQFFNPKYIEKIIQQRNHYSFYIAGLLSNTKNVMWENVVSLLPYADSVELRYANCDRCGSKNTAKYHLGNGLVGDNYEVICEKCFSKE